MEGDWKKKRKWWNEEAVKICKEKGHGDIDKELHRRWLIHKSHVLENEADIFFDKKVQPTNMKRDTLNNNRERVAQYRERVLSIEEELKSLRGQNVDKRKLKRLEGDLAFFRQKLRKAQDALRKILNKIRKA